MLSQISGVSFHISRVILNCLKKGKTQKTFWVCFIQRYWIFTLLFLRPIRRKVRLTNLSSFYSCSNLHILSDTKLVFQSHWSTTKENINFFKQNMSRYKNLLNEHVTTDQITQEYDARQLAYEARRDYDKTNSDKDYETARNYIAPRFYEKELEKFHRGFHPESGNWLHENDQFKRWLDTDDLTMRTLWLQGIPGAGNHHNSILFITHSNTDGVSRENGVSCEQYHSNAASGGATIVCIFSL